MARLQERLPSTKQRLKALETVASTLACSGNLNDVPLVEIEKDGRWVTRRKNMIMDSITPYDAPSQSKRQREGGEDSVRDRSSVTSTVREGSVIRGNKRLGMGGL
jgi:hypothetical protein